MLQLNLKDGDIIGFSGHYWNSDLINLATYGCPRWSISHVGLLARKNPRSKWLVFEANEEVPWQCAVTHRKHDGVQAHSLDLLLDRYKGKMWLYGLQGEAVSKLDLGQQWLSLYDSLCNELGTPYDWRGAKRAGGHLWSWVHSLFCKEDTSSLFCSELVAMVLSEFGIFNTGNASKWSPNKLMRTLVRKGIYKPAVRLK
jgi:hypothetical protein